MRGTAVLCSQHLGRMFRAHWKIQGKRVLRDNGALKFLTEQGIEYEDANDVVKGPPRPPRVFDFPNSRSVKTVESPSPYLIFYDTNVLVGGFNQAKVLTNSVLVPPETLPVLNPEKESVYDKQVKRCIRSSLLFDAHQEKLPKRKDPEREAWNFPRDYGVPSQRKCQLMINRLVQLCSSLSPQLLAHRRAAGNLRFVVPLEREGEKVVCDVTGDVILSSALLEPPSNLVDKNTLDESVSCGLPDLYPTNQIVSINSCDHPYKKFYPISQDILPGKIHTVFFHYDRHNVLNLYDVDVTEDQAVGRGLVKAFCFAVAQAEKCYGEEVKDLPEPITVQCVQTDLQKFYFSILQLNTTACHSKTDKRNFYWSQPPQLLYETCDVIDGVPVLDGYNPSIFKTILSFYYNN